MPDAIDPTLYAYDFAVMAPDSTMYHLPHAGLVIEEAPKELATVTRVRLPDVMTSVGFHMAELVQPGMRYYVSVSERGPVSGTFKSPTTSWGAAWDPSQVGTPGGIIRGQGASELTRGIIHRISRTASSAELEIEGSDNLHSLLEHDIDLHVTAGQQAQEVMESLFAQWGTTLGEYAGPHCELPEKNWRGERASKVIDEILAFGPRQGVGQFLLRANGDHFDIVAAGLNAPTYWLQLGMGAGISSYSIDISQIVGRVIVETEIGDKADQFSDAPIILTTEKEGASEYGGATRIISRDEKSTMQINQLEMDAALAKYGFPDQTFQHTTVDVPFLHKYDRLRISDNILNGYFLVTGISHDASQMQMHATLMTPEDFERQAHLISTESQLAELKNQEKQIRHDESPSAVKKLGKRTFNRDIPTFHQAQGWTCSAASLAALLQMCWVDATENDMVQRLGSGIDPYANGGGLQDASGTQLIRILREEHITGTAQSLTVNQYEQALAIFAMPDGAVGMMSGGAWYHWTAIRGADAGGLRLMNPADGYKGVSQVMSRADFERLGPWNLVIVRSLPKEKEGGGEDASGWEFV